MQQRQRRFGEWLMELKLIQAADLEQALSQQASDERYLGEILLQAAVIDEPIREGILALQKLLASSTRLAEVSVAPEILRRVPPRFARDNAVLPLFEIADWLIVAAPHSEDPHLLAALSAAVGGQVYAVAYRSSDIQEATQVAYDPRRAKQAGMEWIQDEWPSDGPILTFVGSGDAVGTGARNQTCLHLRSQDAHFLIDCGPTSLTGLKQLGLATAHLDGILLTHAHGDHFAGVPFVLLDCVEQKRERPFWVMAPPHLIERIQQWNQLCYPGLFEQLPFELRFLPIEQEPKSIPGTGIMVYPFAMEHQRELPCLGYQIHLPEEKIIAYSGDTAWCDHLELLARDTDLLVCECSYLEPQTHGGKHLNYQEIQAKRSQLRTRHLILSHLGAEMLQAVAQGQIEEETAYDGLSVDLSSLHAGVEDTDV